MKIRIRIHKRLTRENVMLSLSMFFVFSFALLEYTSISIPLFSLVKFPLLYAGGLCVLSHINIVINSLRKKKYFYVFLLLFLMCVLLLLSALDNRNTTVGTSPINPTIRLVLFLIELFVLMVWISETGRGQYAIRFLLRYTLILAIITDFLLFSRLLVFSSGKFETYLVGTKFNVSYLHMDLLTLWFLKNNGRFHVWNKSKVLVILIAVFIVVLSIYVDCMTGLLGCIALVCLFALLNTPVQRKILRLSSPNMLALFFAASVIFPFLAESIVSIPAVSYLLESIFARSSTLTGRINIFTEFSEKMQGHWFWGFGFGNGNAAAVGLFGYANAQNALLHWILQSGVLVTAVFIALAILIFGQLRKSRDQMRIMPLAALIYVYIIMGAVEITYIMNFILWLAMIFALTNEKKSAQKQ